jgi:hypothetical protein
MAYYDESHVRRLRLLRTLREVGGGRDALMGQMVLGQVWVYVPGASGGPIPA